LLVEVFSEGQGLLTSFESLKGRYKHLKKMADILEGKMGKISVCNLACISVNKIWTKFCLWILKVGVLIKKQKKFSKPVPNLEKIDE
jgi:hypothetical protein